jgi:hypothetical protein
LRSLSARFRRQQPVEADIARERRVQRVGLVAAARRRERARLPVAPRRFLSFRVGQRGNTGQHVGPRSHAQRGADAPRDLVDRARRRAGLAEPVERRGLERARRVIRQAPVAVRAVLGGQAIAPLHPRRARGRDVPARGALERIERKITSHRRAPGELAPGQRTHRIAVDGRELALHRARRAMHFIGERLGETQVARLAGKTHARALVRLGQIAAREQGGEHRIACIRGRGAGEPQHTPGGQCGIAFLHAALLNGIARELDILARHRDVILREIAPLPALRQRFQPVAAQPIADRRPDLALQERAHLGRVRFVEAQPQLPIRDIGGEQVVLQRGGERVETAAVAAIEGVLGAQHIGVGLRGCRRSRSEDRPQEQMGGKAEKIRDHEPALSTSARALTTLNDARRPADDRRICLAYPRRRRERRC